MNDADINYTKEAFLNSGNLAFLAVAAVTALVISLLSGSPNWLFEFVLLLTGGVELLYLGIMPRNARFQRHVRSQKIAERQKPPSQKEIFNQLSRRSQRRYARLRKLREEIQTNYRDLSYASQGLLESHLKKIDGLLESYLELLHQRERYRGYMDSATENEVLKSIEALRKDMADDSERVRAVKQRRLRVLEQRLARFRKGHENLEIIGAQLGTIEDVVKYIHEQSWTLQNPQEITFQLDTLLEEVEETQASVKEIEDVFSSPSDYLDDELESLDADLEAGAPLDLPPEEKQAPEDKEAPEPSGSQQSRVRG